MPRFRLPIVVTAALCAVVVGAAPAAAGSHVAIAGGHRAATAERAPDPAPQITALENRVAQLTNDQRRAHGCGPLRFEERLRWATRYHSQDMARRNYFSHTSPEGKGPGDRANAVGYPRWSGENIAAGYATAEAVVQGWMNSEGHRANILNCQSKAIGVGVADSPRGKYWTQMFGFE